jgi:hypothetical protein
MTNPYADYERTGYKKLLDLAKTLCRLVSALEPQMRGRFGDNLAMMALLTAVTGLCSLLPEADTEYKAATLDSALPADTIEETAGVDLSAPEPVAPDIT